MRAFAEIIGLACQLVGNIGNPGVRVSGGVGDNTYQMLYILLLGNSDSKAAQPVSGQSKRNVSSSRLSSSMNSTKF